MTCKLYPKNLKGKPTKPHYILRSDRKSPIWQNISGQFCKINYLNKKKVLPKLVEREIELKKFFSFLYLIFLSNLILGCSSTVQIKQAVSVEDPIIQFRVKLNKILQDSVLYQTKSGLKIVSLETGETLYTHDSHMLFHPASNMKLLTTAVALKQLGPNFKFKTTLSIDTNSIENGTIKGNLYLKGYGNPDLTTDDFRHITSELKSKGIRKISGDLICDDTYFDDLYLGYGWMWDDTNAQDFAPISALSVNSNCIIIEIRPANHIGDTLIFRMDPETAYMKIENYGITVDSLDTLMQKSFKVERKWKNHENTIVIKGGMTIHQNPEVFNIEVTDAALYAGVLFKELLLKENIQFAGNILKEEAPDTSQILIQHNSSPLTISIINTNKESDNLSAELILKTMGAEVKGQPGTADKGISLIHQYFNEIGIDSTTYRITDGSGVSRYNLITPDMIIELLKDIHQNAQIQAEFKSSLPIAGVDGSLNHRMKGTAAENTLRAKTGTLKGVSSLSGYATTADDEMLAFSIMMEHFIVPVIKIQNIQDKICILISSFSRNQMKK
jgi:D-alanyl-D-alanine carboxypeptidase/D-alanyl-D-alanine-endopeptidase (penicillin-binding protein 4)